MFLNKPSHDRNFSLRHGSIKKLDLEEYEYELLTRLLGPSSSIAFRQFLSLNNHPKILMSAMEFGTIKINGEPITAKVGGLAVVINDLIREFPLFLKRHGFGTVSFVFMSFDGVPDLTYVKTFEIDMAHRQERVELYRYDDESGSTLYFLSCPLFKKYSIRDPNRCLYNKEPSDWSTSRYEWEEAYTLALFNKAIACTQKFLEATIYHAHDYHTALAALHMAPETVISLSIHNCGPGYEGKFYTHGFGETRVQHKKYPFGIPAGDFVANDHLLKMIGVDHDTYMRYFEDHGAFNTIKITKLIEKNNLIGGMPVSQGYAKELKEKGFLSGTIVGVENGLGTIYHAKNHPFLAKKNESQLHMIHPLIHDKESRREWLCGLNFGDALDTIAGQQKVHQIKAKLKKILQVNANLEVNPSRPLYVTLSRLVDQKNIAVFAENISHLVYKGAQVIIAGKPGDGAGEDLARHIHYLENLPQNLGQVRFYNEFINKEMTPLIQGGADFFVITSKFEPCGLTDIEAAWLGTIPITKKTGGLGKVKSSFTYEWENSCDLYNESLALRKVLDMTIDFYNNNQDNFKNLRIAALGESFSWDMAINRYFNNYMASSFYKLTNALNNDLAIDYYSINSKILPILRTIFRRMDTQFKNFFIELITQKRDRSIIENIILCELRSLNISYKELEIKDATGFGQGISSNEFNFQIVKTSI